MSRTDGERRRVPRRGITYIEVLTAVLILAIASTAAFATWGIALRAVTNRRLTDMAVIIGARVIDRLKAEKYLNLPDVSTTNPTVWYYDRYGSEVSAAAFQGYAARWSCTPIINRDQVANTEDLREIRVQVWNNSGTTLFETARTLLTFGGV